MNTLQIFIMNPRKHLVFLIFFTVSFMVDPSMASSHNTTLEFRSFPPQNFTLLGDSYLRHDVAGLSLESNLLASSSGTIMYTTPLRFSSNCTNSSASFSTRFSFSIVNGVTFFILPENRTLGSPGGYMGVVDASGLTKNKFIAIENDTHLNAPNSIKTAEYMDTGIDLRNGTWLSSWIDFHHGQENLKSLLTLEMDLCSYFQEHTKLGFASATKETTTGLPMIVLSVVVSCIKQYEYEYPSLINNCKFQSYGIEYLNPVNVTDETITGSHVVSCIKQHQDYSLIGLGLGVLAFFLGYISVNKWSGEIIGFFQQQLPIPVSLHDIDDVLLCEVAAPVSKHHVPNPNPPSLTSSVTKQGDCLDLDSSKQREVSLPDELQSFFSIFLAIFLMSSALQKATAVTADVAANDDDNDVVVACFDDHEHEATSTVAVDDVAAVDGDDMAADVALV